MKQMVCRCQTSFRKFLETAREQVLAPSGGSLGANDEFLLQLCACGHYDALLSHVRDDGVQMADYTGDVALIPLHRNT